MAIASMTGFARVQVACPACEDQISYTLTVKSVNHRFLDLQFRLPIRPRCPGDGFAPRCSKKTSFAATSI